MAGLPWIRLDTSIYDNPKLLILASEKEFQASNLFLLSLAYCGKHGTGGFVLKYMLPRLHGRERDAKRLCEIGLWHVSPGGWTINGYDEYQYSDDAARARSEKAAKAAAARWDKHRHAQ